MRGKQRGNIAGFKIFTERGPHFDLTFVDTILAPSQQRVHENVQADGATLIPVSPYRGHYQVSKMISFWTPRVQGDSVAGKPPPGFGARVQSCQFPHRSESPARQALDLAL
jgi:hypothetical protein